MKRLRARRLRRDLDRTLAATRNQPPAIHPWVANAARVRQGFGLAWLEVGDEEGDDRDKGDG